MRPATPPLHVALVFADWFTPRKRCPSVGRPRHLEYSGHIREATDTQARPNFCKFSAFYCLQVSDKVSYGLNETPLVLGRERCVVADET